MKNALILILMVLTQVFGDLWLSEGMKVFGQVTSFTLPAVLSLVGYLLTSPWIVLGVVTLIFSLICYLTAISRFDLSYVLPIHASGYVFNALFAWLILGEQVSGLRWAATVLVAFGVYLINRSQRKTASKPSPNPVAFRKPMPALLFLVATTPYMPRIWLGVAVLVLADAAGDLLLARGMKQVGRVSLRSLPELIKLGQQIIFNPWILRGVGAQAIAFFAFLCLLSWADVSYVRPATALTYAASLLGARYLLQEPVVPGRFWGMVV
ncbi:MAG: EamA family transporter, partial [Thermosynechococcaceae cyanobacterium]